MIKVIIFGSGNVATQLTKAFLKSKKVTVMQIYSRKNKNPFFGNNNIEVIHDFENLKEADVYIIAISDDVIQNFVSQIPIKDNLIVHTSGAVAMDAINSSRKGVFYPLQTISKDKKMSFKKVPICIEANSNNDLKLLNKLAKIISKKVYKINSEQRKSLHVAAVFVNNFVNHLYVLAEEICLQQNVPFAILKPLISETAKKIKKLSPQEAQTGPAKRNDFKTIASHLKLLNEEQQKIYQLLSNSIRNKKR
ncbi:MAG TPA: DUF2520 domain-containing protein [Flavobacteriia bacterium]|nr:DUF2520 domain-containing protein [Flavobacteriia bacterium]